MPYKDKEKQKEYQRKWAREKYSNDENKEHRLEIRSEWRDRNRESINSYAKEWKKTDVGLASQSKVAKNIIERNKQRLIELKSILCCSECGENRSACLDFHHIDRSTKSYTIAHMITRKFSWEKILEEIDKCIVLCANCHRVLHAEQKAGML